MIGDKFHILDDSGIKWWLGSESATVAKPYCAVHHMPLNDPPRSYDKYFRCDDCEEAKFVDRGAFAQKTYVVHKIHAQQIAQLEVVNYNDQLIPIAKTKSKDENYSITAQIMNSKHGKQLVIYAGKKGHKNTQIFVDTVNHKLAFDHKDTLPTEVFAKIEATFKNGTKMAIEAEPQS